MEPIARLVKYKSDFAILDFCLMCGVQFSFLSIVIPRYFVVLLYGMLMWFSVKGVMVGFFCFLWKSIAVDFVGLNLSPQLLPHSTILLRMAWSSVTSVSGLLPSFPARRSSAKPVASIPASMMSCRRVS